jgi:hypothetical protein
MSTELQLFFVYSNVWSENQSAGLFDIDISQNAWNVAVGTQ